MSELHLTTLSTPFAFGSAATLVALAAASALAQGGKPTTSISGDVGYVSASGNTNLTTLSVGERIIRTDGRWTFTQRAVYVYGKTNDKESARQTRLSARVDFDFQPRLGVFAGLAYERNTFAGFNSRTDQIVGLRWKALVEPNDSLSLDAGGVNTVQNNVDRTRQTTFPARIATNYKHRFSKTAYFLQLAEYVPNLTTNGAFRAYTESSLVAPISEHIGIKTSYSLRYDSRPPVNFGKTDRILTTGIQLTF